MKTNKSATDLDQALSIKRRQLRYAQTQDAQLGTINSKRVISGGAPNGGAACVVLRPGFYVSAYDIEAQPGAQAAARSEPCLAIVLILSGTCERSSTSTTASLRYEPGCCYVTHVSSIANEGVAMNGSGRLQLVDIRLSIDFLQSLGNTDFLDGLTENHPLCMFQGQTFWLGAAEPSAQMFASAAQLFSATMASDQSDLQLERAALTIIDEVFALFGAPQSITCGSHQHAVRAARIKSLMASDLSHKWSLKELSESAAISQRGLSQLFRDVFATSVYACLQSMRLQRARNLIAEGGMTVTAASHAVGYDSPTHFAALFKREFGYSPSSLKQ